MISNQAAGGPLSLLRAEETVFPALLYGARLSLSAALALYAAFFLQLDQPGWAGTSAVIVAQPVLGAALRKGLFRLIGTLAGAAAGVAIVTLFPQSCAGFFFGLALWCGLCAFAATALRNFAAYGGVIAGFTAALVALNVIEAPNDVLMVAISRATAIILGIVSTTLVFSLTGAGRASNELARRAVRIAGETVSALIAALRYQAQPVEITRTQRRRLIADVAALDAIIDQAAGESAAIRARAAVLKAALSGLFAALSSWRAIEAHLNLAPRENTMEAAGAVLTALLQGERPGSLLSQAEKDPAGARGRLREAAQDLFNLPAPSPSARLLADQTGRALLGLSMTMNGITLLETPSLAEEAPYEPLARTFDPLIALVNGLRVALVIAASALFWIFSQWPNGTTFITFAILVSLFYTRQTAMAFDTGVSRALGCFIAAVAAGVLKFVLLPSRESFLAFSLLLSAYLIPGGALATLPAAGPTAFLATVHIIPMLSPANQMDYDVPAFLNNAMAIVMGSLAGIVGYRLVPPLSPGVRSRRLLSLSLHDLRRLAGGRWNPAQAAWETRIYDRLTAMPEQATLLQRGQLIAVLGIGLAILSARESSPPELSGRVNRIFSLLADGNVSQARGQISALLKALMPHAHDPGQAEAQRLCAALQEIDEAIESYGDFLEGGGQ